MKRLAVLLGAIAVLIAAIVTGRPVTAAVTYPVPDSIPADCSAATSTELNAFIASVPDGTVGANGPVYSVVEFPPGGCYRVEDVLTVPRRAYLRFDGRGTTIESHDVDNAGSQPAWDVRFSHHVYFEDLIVRGDNPRPSYYSGPPREWSHGWLFKGSHDIGVDRVEVHNVYGDGVVFAPGWDDGQNSSDGCGRTAPGGPGGTCGIAAPSQSVPVNSWNGHVRDSLVDGSGRMCLATTGGHDYAWEDNVLENCPWIFDDEPQWDAAGFWIENLTIARNRTGFYRLVWFANGGQCNAGRGNVVVKDNVMWVPGPTSWPAISIDPPDGCAPRGPYTITGNLFRVAGRYGVSLSGGGAHDVLMAQNTVVFTGSYNPRAGAYVENSTRVQVLDNCLYHATQVMVVVNSTEVTESGNRFDCIVPF